MVFKVASRSFVALMGLVAQALATDDSTYKISEADIQSTELSAHVVYGGGCRVHRFSLGVTGDFSEGNQIQLPVEILHENNNDACERAISTLLHFNITPMIESYKTLYQREHGEFQMMLRGFGQLNVNF